MSNLGVAGDRREKVRLTCREVAEMLGLSTQRVYSLCGQGVLPHRKVGRATWFLRPELEAWLRGEHGQGHERSALSRS